MSINHRWIMAFLIAGLGGIIGMLCKWLINYNITRRFILWSADVQPVTAIKRLWN
jgi:hypothetical protein